MGFLIPTTLKEALTPHYTDEETEAHKEIVTSSNSHN